MDRPSLARHMAVGARSPGPEALARCGAKWRNNKDGPNGRSSDRGPLSSRSSTPGRPLATEPRRESGRCGRRRRQATTTTRDGRTARCCHGCVTSYHDLPAGGSAPAVCQSSGAARRMVGIQFLAAGGGPKICGVGGRAPGGCRKRQPQRLLPLNRTVRLIVAGTATCLQPLAWCRRQPRADAGSLACGLPGLLGPRPPRWPPFATPTSSGGCHGNDETNGSLSMLGHVLPACVAGIRPARLRLPASPSAWHASGPVDEQDVSGSRGSTACSALWKLSRGSISAGMRVTGDASRYERADAKCGGCLERGGRDAMRVRRGDTPAGRTRDRDRVGSRS